MTDDLKFVGKVPPLNFKVRCQNASPIWKPS